MDFSHLRHRFRHASLGARVIAGLTILTISIAAVYSVTLWWSFTWVKNYVAADRDRGKLRIHEIGGNIVLHPSETPPEGDRVDRSDRNRQDGQAGNDTRRRARRDESDDASARSPYLKLNRGIYRWERPMDQPAPVCVRINAVANGLSTA